MQYHNVNNENFCQWTIHNVFISNKYFFKYYTLAGNLAYKIFIKLSSVSPRVC